MSDRDIQELRAGRGKVMRRINRMMASLKEEGQVLEDAHMAIVVVKEGASSEEAVAGGSCVPKPSMAKATKRMGRSLNGLIAFCGKNSFTKCISGRGRTMCKWQRS